MQCTSTRAVRTRTPIHAQNMPYQQMCSPYFDKPLSRSYTYKKITKPLLERRRRARISKCLDELKEILVGPMGISEETINRLEKADILELAVEHLQNLQSSSRCRANRYQEGFNECAATACHFIETSMEVEESLCERLAEHLETCTGPLQIDVPQYHLTFSPPVSPVSFGTSPKSFNQISLSDLGSTKGLLMEVKKRPSLFSENQSKRFRKSVSENIVYSGICTPPAEEKDSMWRPW